MFRLRVYSHVDQTRTRFETEEQDNAYWMAFHFILWLVSLEQTPADIYLANYTLFSGEHESCKTFPEPSFEPCRDYLSPLFPFGTESLKILYQSLIPLAVSLPSMKATWNRIVNGKRHRLFGWFANIYKKKTAIIISALCSLVQYGVYCLLC